MNVKQELARFKSRIDKEIAAYLDEAIAEAKKEGVFIAGTIVDVKDFILSGGKRLRGAMMYYGYLAAGGREYAKAMKACVSIELIHAFLLIHDDIIDRDEKRHGVPTIHARYHTFAKRRFLGGDSAHFGNSVAIIVGDMASALGSQRIFTANFSPDRIVRALRKLQQTVSRTIVGQASDMYMGYARKATEHEVMKMYENKTARYTMEGPLHLGAVLAGAPDATLRAMSAYAVPLGIAFQIQDDILGVFGDEKKLGKTVGADIAEGKMTILVTHALKNASSSERKFLQSVLGKKTVSSSEIREVQKVFIGCGARDYAASVAKKCIEEGKQALADIPFQNTRARDFLVSVAEYMGKRET